MSLTGILHCVQDDTFLLRHEFLLHAMTRIGLSGAPQKLLFFRAEEKKRSGAPPSPLGFARWETVTVASGAVVLAPVF